MISLTRCAVAIALMLWATGFFLRVQSQTKIIRKGSVAGKVTIKNKPAPGIVVGLRNSEPSGTPFEVSLKATTDHEGHYRIIDVPAGSYRVAPMAPAFVISNISNMNDARGEVVIMREGEVVEGVDFALVRGGVITGKITDVEGQPVIEQPVNLFRADAPANQPAPPFGFSGAQTDDRGVYRIFGIPPGSYKIAAGNANEFGYTPGMGRAYRQTFYPNGSDVAKAIVLEVTEGSEALNIDLILGQSDKTFAASGRVVDGESGQPVGGASFGVQFILDARHHSQVGLPVISNSRGEFRIENLPAGKYRLFVRPLRDSDLRSDPVPFEIVDQDVSGLLVKTTKGEASLAGSVVLENTDDKVVFARLLKLHILGHIQNSASGFNPGHTSMISSDGSFLLNNLEPGNLYISLGAPNSSMLKGFFISRIERYGVAEPRLIEVKIGDQITGIRVVVSYGSATVRGVVRLANGELPAGSRVHVRITRVGDMWQNIQAPQVDARGHFLAEGIPAGLYSLEAHVFVPGSAGPILPVSQQVNVLDMAVTEVEITVPTNASTSPTTP